MDLVAASGASHGSSALAQTFSSSDAEIHDLRSRSRHARERVPDHHMYEWDRDLGTGSVKATKFDDRSIEFPTVDSRFYGLDYRYGYNACSMREQGLSLSYDGTTAGCCTDCGSLRGRGVRVAVSLAARGCVGYRARRPRRGRGGGGRPG